MEDNYILKSFLSDFKLNSKDFFNGYVPIKEVTYSIAVIYDNNFRKDIYDITNPWQFMNALKKNPRVKTCWIIDENNP